MKKLKCKSCSKVWYVDDSELNNQTVCPFCALSIKEEVKLDKYDTLDKAIYGALMRGGLEILKTPLKMSAYMFDMCPDLKKEIRIFSRTVTNDYVNDMASAFCADIKKADDIFLRMKMQMIDNDGISETWAETICNALRGANMFMRGINMPGAVSAEVTNIATPSQQISVNQPNNKKYVPKGNAKIIDSGKAGAKSDWTLYDDGTLVISGTGAMKNYDDASYYPWYDYESRITSVIIESGVTTIGEKAFKGYRHLEAVYINEGLRTIGDFAFAYCGDLLEIYLPKSLEKLGSFCFVGCYNISEITIDKNVHQIGFDCFEGWKNTQIINIKSKKEFGLSWDSRCSATINRIK